MEKPCLRGALPTASAPALGLGLVLESRSAPALGLILGSGLVLELESRSAPELGLILGLRLVLELESEFRTSRLGRLGHERSA